MEKLCIDCQLDISDRGKGAKRCVECADISVRQQRTESAKRYRENNREKVNARWKELDKERRKDPEFLEKRRQQSREQQRRRRQDSDYREMDLARNRVYRQKPEAKAKAKEKAQQHRAILKQDPEALAASNAQHLKLWQERRRDPEVVKEQNRKAAERRRWRWANDPEYRARINSKQPERHRRRRQRIQERLLIAQGWKCGDVFKCGWKGCGKDLRDVPTEEIHVDHIVPVAKGGRNDQSNLQVLCKDCNIEARDRMPMDKQLSF